MFRPSSAHCEAYTNPHKTVVQVTWLRFWRWFSTNTPGMPINNHVPRSVWFLLWEDALMDS